MDDLLSDFLTETTENLAILDVELVKLEQNPDPKTLSSIFRLVHTIKGTCGFLGLSRLERIAHAGETVLGGFRDGELAVAPQAVTAILACLDRIKMILRHIESSAVEPEGDDEQLIEQLKRVTEGGKLDWPGAGPVSEPVPVVAPLSPQLISTSDALATATPTEAPVDAQTLRVNVGMLENLMTLVSELVLTRNQLLQMVRGRDDSEFATPLSRLSHITTDLQEGVMKTRMQPIGNAWAKLPRIVRDLSIELKKKIDLQMNGAETELDRQVLELIKDPLLHMVRNAADHGLESSDERRRIGKPETGRIMLNAYHEGGHIVIEIADDGRGLDILKIRQKVLALGLATEGELEQMSETQQAQFIFNTGFSTAEKVTSVSGRGVGMDVVRNNIEKIGGTIELQTQRGSGTRFAIKIPLTLAIVSALVVECAGERFAIPQISILELVRTTADSKLAIEVINNTPVLRLRDRLLPVVSLRRLLRLADDEERTETFVVVTQVGTYSFGIMVDRVFDTEEIVVKPVAPFLRSISMFSGTTILGDGSVIMILDPNGIAASIGEIAGGSHAEADSAAPRSLAVEDRQSLLIFRAGGSGLKGIPLALVARLEAFDAMQIEMSHNKPVIQYRGKLMPLVTVDGSYGPRTKGRQPALVFADGSHSMGLLVDEIVDIVVEKLKVELTVDRPGLIGTAVIAGKATDILDTGYFLTQAWGDWFGKPDDEFQGKREGKRILLVDDSPFFRTLLTPLLAVAGYDVVSVDSADKALSLRDSGDAFDAIISDIEMPGMNGFEFARAVRADGPWAGLPMVALSSHATERDFEHGREVGFTDYVAKFDRDALLRTLLQSLSAKGAA